MMNAQILTSIAIYLLVIVQVCHSISAADVYQKMLERERNIDNTFAFNFVRPIGSVAGELIWPRSYSTSSEIMFDENGAAFNLHERPSLYRIMQKTRTSSLRSGAKYQDNYENYYEDYRSRVKRFARYNKV